MCLFISLPFFQCAVSALIVIVQLCIYTYKDLRLVVKYMGRNSFSSKD